MFIREGLPERTKIIAVPFGKTERVTKFKVGKEKPRGHIIWGKDTPDGASCSIIITNVSIAMLVYRYDFVYRKKSFRKGYNFLRGKIYELNRRWNSKIGNYVVALYVNNERVSTDLFAILP